MSASHPFLDHLENIGVNSLRERAETEVFSGRGSALLFMRSTQALLKRSNMAAAICGDKSSLKEEKDNYYSAFYEFADPRPDLCVVRLFGCWDKSLDCARDTEIEKRLAEHRERRNVIGLWVGDYTNVLGDAVVPGFGLVLFKHAHCLSVVLHWKGNQSTDFCWTATSDPRVTMIFMDTWAELCDQWEPKTESERESLTNLAAFRRRFGMLSNRK